MNIVHGDLKLKVADFGLSSIVATDNKSDNDDEIHNVGAPMYKSPELIEGYNSKDDISNLIVLKSCDVFINYILASD